MIGAKIIVEYFMPNVYTEDDLTGIITLEDIVQDIIKNDSIDGTCKFVEILEIERQDYTNE